MPRLLGHKAHASLGQAAPATSLSANSAASPLGASPAVPGRARSAWSPGGIGRAFRGERTLTLSIDKHVIRAVVFQRGRVVAWGSTDAAAASTAGDGKAGPTDAALALQLKPLLQGLGEPQARVITDFPLMTSLLRHVRLPNLGRRHLKQVIPVEAVESVPFTLEEVDIAWQLRGSRAAKTAAVCLLPKGAVDRHVRLLGEAGVRPAAAYARAVALALVAGEPNGLVLYLERASAAVILVADGVPRVLHELGSPGADAAPAVWVELIARGLEQVTSYYEAAEGKPDSRALPLVLTGPLAAQAPLVEALRQTLGRELRTAAAPLPCPDLFPAHEYVVNLGLALADRVRTKSGGMAASPIGPAVNLLPIRYQPRPLPVLPGVAVGMLLAAGLLTFTFAGHVTAAEADRAALTAHLAALQRQERDTQLTLAQARVRDREVQQTNQLTQRLETKLAEFNTDFTAVTARLQAVTGPALPPSAQLTSIELEPDGFALVGKAASYDDILRFAKNLRDSALFLSVKVVRADAPPGGLGQPSGPAPGPETLTFQIKASTISALAPSSQGPAKGK